MDIRNKAGEDGYLLGIDIGSSSIKVAVVSIASGKSVHQATSPSEEMPILAYRDGWAEQDPETWWKHVVICVKDLVRRTPALASAIKAIGIAYQMHGLVAVDRNQNAVRKSIIWCDSRASTFGAEAFRDLGEQYCLSHLLNSPGNFTASKLAWVRYHEPQIFEKIHKIMLPGDFIAMKLTGDITTTASGMSEGIFWDFSEGAVSKRLLAYYGFQSDVIPLMVPTFSIQGKLSTNAARELQLSEGIPIGYRSGDQPNNAFSLNVLQPGEMATTAGTSGVIYSVTDKNIADSKSRINTFLHVNNHQDAPRNGLLLCANGTGIQNSWLRKNIRSDDKGFSYEEMNALASQIPIGSDGVLVYPFGNGAERMFENRSPKGSIHGLNFNVHQRGHLFRAAQEGIVFSLRFGYDILEKLDVRSHVVKAGHANMFLSKVFREAFVNTLDIRLELFDTDGATGAALGAGVGVGIFPSYPEAFRGLNIIALEETDPIKREIYAEAYGNWRKNLNLNFEPDTLKTYDKSIKTGIL